MAGLGNLYFETAEPGVHPAFNVAERVGRNLSASGCREKNQVNEPQLRYVQR